MLMGHTSNSKNIFKDLFERVTERDKELPCLLVLPAGFEPDQSLELRIPPGSPAWGMGSQVLVLSLAGARLKAV